MHPIDVVSDDESSLSSKKPKYAYRVTKNNDYNSPVLADGGMPTEREGNEMAEMATGTVVDESNNTENTIPIDEQMIGFKGDRGKKLHLPYMRAPVEDGYQDLCDRGYNSSFLRVN